MSMQIGKNFTASSYGGVSSALPADCNGAVGPKHFVEFINGEFAVFNKTNGNSVKRISDLKFWSNAGILISFDYVTTDPRVIYDSVSQRWFATQVDASATSQDPTTQANDFLFAVSSTSDPTGTWHGFLFQADPDNGYFADFPTLGVDSNAVYISGDFYQESIPLGPGLVSIPKSDLLLSTPTIDNRTWYGVMDYEVRGDVLQPATCFDGTSSGNIIAMGNIGDDTIDYSNLVCFAVQNGGTPNGSLTDSSFMTVPAYSVPYSDVLSVPQFAMTQPDGSTTLTGNDMRISSRVYGVNGVLFAAHSTEYNGHMAIRWYRVKASTRRLLESGTISDPNLDLGYPAIAANQYGAVVIAYNACGLSTFLSSFATLGQTVNGVTTFGSPVLLKAGAIEYHGDDEIYADLLGTPVISRWGDYNAISVDPNDPTQFWAIVMYPSDTDIWSTQVTQLTTTVPPTLTATNSGTNITLSWPTFATSFQLQSTTNLAPTITWNDITNAPQTNGFQLVLNLPKTGTKQFFRLKK